MRIMLAPDSFKESLAAHDVAAAMAQGVHDVLPDATCDPCPVADGGEGFVEAFVAACDGERITRQVTGPIGKPVDAEYGLIDHGQTAVVELAQAAGLHQVPQDQRDPTRTTTFGVGELIVDALEHGRTKIIIGLGGSATTDGGAGMAQALGVQFFQGDQPINDPIAGGMLSSITRVDRSSVHPLLSKATVAVACDVNNPLVGPRGAAAVYGPQKGATPEQVTQLDDALTHLANLLEVNPDQPGFGAAGGMGFGCVVFAGGTLEPGIEMVLDAVGFDARVAEADLILTGEGKMDGQSTQGKACLGVAQRAARLGKPTYAIVGAAGDEADHCLQHGLTGYRTLVSETVTAAQAMAEPAAHVRRVTAAVVSQWAAIR